MSARGNNSGRNLQPIAPKESTNLYLLQVTDPNSQVPESAPLQLLISGYQEVPPITTKLIEIPQNLQQYLYINDNDRVPHSVSGYEVQQLRSTPKTTLPPSDNTLRCHEQAKPTTSKHHSSVQRKGDVNIQIQKNQKCKERIEDNELIKSSVHIADQVVPNRAIAMLPTALQLRKDSIYPRRLLPPYARFGPVQGVTSTILPSQAKELILKAAAVKEPIFLVKSNKDTIEHIDVSDKDKSSWLSLLPLGDESTANIWLYEDNNKLYGITTESLRPRTALALGYSKIYAEEHKLPPGLPVIDLNDSLSDTSKRWWCHECQLAVGSAALLQRHMKVCHENGKKPRQKYRCADCSKTFSKLFALKRHKSRHCIKKKEVPPSPSVNTNPKDDNQLETSTQNSAEESRIPSDESFQNYTNGLDFPTNLFDTDGMSYLDISGSSKSDIDFNPYLTGLHENDTSKQDDKAPGSDSKTKLKKEDIRVPCGYCKQSISKARKFRHLRECPARRFECECGLKFINKDTLAQHIFIKHITKRNNATDQGMEPESKETEGSNNKLYKCEHCTTEIHFKRRGMLVNHLYRTHNIVSGSIPLERSKLHYPCTICPKIYCSAAKRNQHVAKYHPEADKVSAAPIESTPRPCQPFCCKHCPSQYTTRSKLLQHMRTKHQTVVDQLNTRAHQKFKKRKNV